VVRHADDAFDLLIASKLAPTVLRYSMLAPLFGGADDVTFS